jgi:hypothetical protein
VVDNLVISESLLLRLCIKIEMSLTIPVSLKICKEERIILIVTLYIISCNDIYLFIVCLVCALIKCWMPSPDGWVRWPTDAEGSSENVKKAVMDS